MYEPEIQDVRNESLGKGRHKQITGINFPIIFLHLLLFLLSNGLAGILLALSLWTKDCTRVTGLDKQYSTSRRHDSYWKANTTEEKIPKFIDFLLAPRWFRRFECQRSVEQRKQEM